MKQSRQWNALKSLLLCTAAVTLATSSFAQDRMQSQDRPAATGQAPAEQPSSRAQGREDNRDAQRPSRDAQKPAANENQRQPSGDNARDNERAQPRDSERNPQRGQARDSNQTPQRNEARDANEPSRRNQARDSDQTPQRDRRDQARDRNQPQERDNAQSQRDRGDRNAAQPSAQPSNRQAAQPTEQQRTRISTSIRQANVQPVRNVNFSVSIGTTIPRSVRVYAVTPAIVEVYPQYRGYSFVLVNEEIVVVHPRTKRIVTVIHEGSAGSAAVSQGGGRAAAASRSKLTLNDRQRDVIRRSAMQRQTTGSNRLTIDREIVVGDDLPDTVEFESFPDTVYTEVPEIRSYRYIVRDRDIYLVDPGERRVIEVIR